MAESLKAMAKLVDDYVKAREERRALAKEVEELEVVEKELKQKIIIALPKNDSDGVAGKLARARLVQKVVPKITNYDDFYAYVIKKKAVHLLQKRFNDAAVQEIWDDKKEVPGVSKEDVLTLSIEMIKKK